MGELITTEQVSPVFGKHAGEFARMVLNTIQPASGLIDILERLKPETIQQSGRMAVHPGIFAQMLVNRLTPGNYWTRIDKTVQPTPPCAEADTSGELIRLNQTFDVHGVLAQAKKGNMMHASPCSECRFECPLRGISDGIQELRSRLAEEGPDGWRNLRTAHPYLRASNYLGSGDTREQFSSEYPQRQIPTSALEAIRVLDNFNPEAELSIQHPDFRPINALGWIGSTVRAYQAQEIDLDDILYLLESTLSQRELEQMPRAPYQQFLNYPGPDSLAIYLNAVNNNSLEKFMEIYPEIENPEQMYRLCKILNKFRSVNVPRQLIVRSDEKAYIPFDRNHPPYFVTKSTRAIFDACRMSVQATLKGQLPSVIGRLKHIPYRDMLRTLGDDLPYVTEDDILTQGRRIYGDEFFTSSRQNADPDHTTLRAVIKNMRCVLFDEDLQGDRIITTYDPEESTGFESKKVNERNEIEPKSPREVYQNLFPHKCGDCEIRSNCYKLRKTQASGMRSQVIQYCRLLEDRYYRFWLIREIWEHLSVN